MLYSDGLNELCECLVSLNPCPVEKLTGLVELCPKLPKALDSSKNPHLSALNTALTSSSVSFDLRWEFGDFPLDARSQQAALTVARFTENTRGQHLNLLLPKLLRHLISLLYSTRKSNPTPTNEQYELFAEQYTHYLLRSGQHITVARKPIIVTLIASLRICAQLLQSVENPEESKKTSYIWPYILSGILKAVANSLFPLDNESAVEFKNSLLLFLFEGEKTDGAKEEKRYPKMRKILPLIQGALALVCSKFISIFSEDELRSLYKLAMKPIIAATIAFSNRRRSALVNAMDLKGYLKSHISLVTACCKGLPIDSRIELSKKLLEIVRKSAKGKEGDANLATPSSDAISEEKDLSMTTKDKVLSVSKEDPFAFSSEALYGLCELCKDFPDLIPEVVDKIFSILMETESSASPSSDSLNTEITAALSRILKIELEITEVSFASTATRRLILQLEDNLQRSSIDPSFEKYENLNLTLLGNITSMVRNRKVSSQVLPVLIQRFQVNPRLLHRVVKNLAEIAHGSDYETFELILSLFVEIYRKPVSQENRYTYNEIRSSLFSMAQKLTDNKQRRLFTRSMLKLIPVLGASIQQELIKTGFKQFTSIVGTLGFVLPTLAELVKPENNVSEFAPLYLTPESPMLGFPAFSTEVTNVRNFRNIWFLLVLFKFVDSTSHLLPEWISAVKMIAANSPTIITRARSYLGLEIEVQALVKTGGPSEEDQFRQSFRKLLPDVESLSWQLNFPKLVFILSIYHLETFRAQNGFFHPMFTYLEDDSLGTGLLAPFTSSVADHVFSKYIEAIDDSRNRNAEDKTTNLVNHMIFLLVKMCNRREIVRERAAKYVDDLTNKFPFLCWNRLCIAAALDLLEFLDRKRRTFEALATFQSSNEFVQLRIPLDSKIELKNIEVNLPELQTVREAIFKVFAKLFSKWIDFVSRRVPVETISVLQEYLQDQSEVTEHFDVSSISHHAGSLGVKCNLSLKYLSADLKNTLGMSTAPVFALSLSQRQKFIGEIQGFYESYSRLDLQYKLSFGLHMSTVLQNEFQQLHLASQKSEKEGKTFSVRNDDESLNSRAVNLVYRIAALIIWSTERTNPYVSAEDRRIEFKELMHLVCICPAVIYTVKVMQAAIFVWHWLFSVSHSFAVSLFINMKAGWSLTIESGHGLFSKQVGDTLLTGEYPGCLFTAKHKRESDDQRLSLEPHRLWIDFFADNLEVLKKGYPSCLRAVTMMVNNALAQPEIIQSCPSSFQIRFKLLSVGLLLIQSEEFEAFELFELLRDRIYMAAFQWFYEAPRWLNTQSPRELSNLSQLIISFCKTLLHEKHHVIAAQDVSNFPGETKSVASGKSVASRNRAKLVYQDSSKGFKTSALDRNWIKAWSSIPGLKDISKEFASHERSYSISRFKLNPTPSQAGSLGPSLAGDGLLKNLVSHRDLLVFLMSDELHRLVAWYNPSRIKERNFPDQDLFADIPLSAQEAHWSRLFQISWSVNPKLAYRLVQRFPHATILSKKLSEKLKIFPSALYEIGDSVTFLASEENVLSQADQLKHLEYYQPCSLPTALKFLVFPYSSNQIVMEYTMRSLASHGPDAVIFYLNEIVQALRYDSFGILRRFLLQQSSKSPYLAHQLIWACQTESVPDKVGVSGSGLLAIDDPVPYICQSLEKEIIEKMSPEDEKFYHAEFKFFSDITTLSRELVSIPKTDKPRRNAELRQRLGSIPLDYKGLYLPIDHTCEVLEIKGESGLCLQSAAKVPFLVSFKIMSRIESIHEKEEEEFVPVVQEPKQEIVDEEPKDDEDVEVKKSQVELVKLPRVERIRDQAVIFKAGDDVRQDCLALKFIRLMKDIMHSVGLKLFLLPYKVVPNRTGIDLQDLGGVIECIPKAKSRDELGKSNNRSLKQEFLSRYGKEDSQAYKAAQKNFIISLAGYAVATYILQVKDRHNGNIMIDEWGHLIHIDFGFIFSISPANNLRFEAASFKFTTEMAELMDGFGSGLYQWFEELCVKGYLAVRDHAEDFCNITNLMMDSPLRCFMPRSMIELRQRFNLDKTERDAATHMIAVVQGAYNHVTTSVYDNIQWQKEGVWFFSGSGEE